MFSLSACHQLYHELLILKKCALGTYRFRSAQTINLQTSYQKRQTNEDIYEVVSILIQWNFGLICWLHFTCHFPHMSPPAGARWAWGLRTDREEWWWQWCYCGGPVGGKQVDMLVYIYMMMCFEIMNACWTPSTFSKLMYCTCTLNTFLLVDGTPYFCPTPWTNLKILACTRCVWEIKTKNFRSILVTIQDPHNVAKLKTQLDEAMALIAKLKVSNQTPVATPPPGGVPTPSPPPSTGAKAPSKATTPATPAAKAAPKVAPKRAATPPQAWRHYLYLFSALVYLPLVTSTSSN